MGRGGTWATAVAGNRVCTCLDWQGYNSWLDRATACAGGHVHAPTHLWPPRSGRPPPRPDSPRRSRRHCLRPPSGTSPPPALEPVPVQHQGTGTGAPRDAEARPCACACACTQFRHCPPEGRVRGDRWSHTRASEFRSGPCYTPDALWHAIGRRDVHACHTDGCRPSMRRERPGPRRPRHPHPPPLRCAPLRS